MKKQLLLGLMAMLLPLTMWAADSPKTFTVTITGADKDGNITYAGDATKPTITVNDAAGKTATAGEYSITYYAVSGSTATKILSSGVRNVGDYKIVVAGIGDEYFDYTSKEVPFKVLPKQVTETLTLATGVSKNYGESDSVMLQKLVKDIPSNVLAANTNAAAERADFLACLKVARYEADEANPEGIGEHKVIVIGEENPTQSNYKYVAPKDGSYRTITINKAQLTVTTTGKPYDGIKASPDTITKTIKGVVNGESVTVTFSYTGEIKNADTYKLKTTLDGADRGNYTVAETVDYTITKLPLTIKPTDPKALTAEYEAQTGNIDVRDLFTFETFLDGETAVDLDVHMYAKIGASGGVGFYDISLYEGKNEVTDLTNYKVTYTPQKYSITPRTFGNGKGFAIKIDDTKATYQGKNFVIPEGLIAITYTHGTPAVTDTLPSNSYDLEIIEATDSLMSASSTFRVQATAKEEGNFSGTMNSNLITITPKMLTITAKENQTWEKPYDGISGQDDLTDHFNIGEFVTGESADSIKLSMRKQYGDPKAQKYNVLVFNGNKTWNATDNAFKNYDITYADTAIFTIKPAAVTYYIKGDSVTYQGNKSYTNATLNNYTVVVEGLAKKDSIFTFRTAPVVAFADTTVTSATNAGNYALTVTNVDNVRLTNYALTYDGTKNTPLVIKKADAHIKAPTLDPIAFGDTLSVEYLAGLVDDYNKTIISTTEIPYDSDRRALRRMVELQLSDSAKTYKSGTYETGLMIVEKDTATLTPADQILYGNFNIIPVHSPLTILGLGTLTLDGNLADLTDSLKANGAMYEKIVVKNLRSRNNGGINAEKWYMLVLPFDVTVRELSREFGYAIVNIPDTTNTDPEVMKFKLTMQTVPANTLMAFKVDETMDWSKLGDEVAFEDKTIVTPTGKWATDKAGNQFIGVYKETETKGKENGDYWMHTDGSFWNGVTTINPLAGYVHFESAPANARFILENPDGSTTTISAVSVDAVKNTEGWYTVGGVKLEAEPTQKGVYINNGKKVVIK